MHLDLIKKELAAEQEALSQIAGQVNQDMEDFLATLMQCRGRIVICAQDQNREAGRKTFSALTQADTPCIFVYNDETFAPDVELVFPEDTLLLLSLEGDSDTHQHLLRFVHEQRCKLAAITSDPESPAAKVAHSHLTATSPATLGTLGYLLARAFNQARELKTSADQA
ncbi:SIS domain-containing protein [Marinospirillum perlucidum]|uniref:SIS domain-containing protein n=1 Tax=Marinospirillum perlucidum TaxID=1982602 RepID=UPI000DF2B0DE|nr:SIS domain-containing protein [Marinospirillum perlucidum]